MPVETHPPQATRTPVETPSAVVATVVESPTSAPTSSPTSSTVRVDPTATAVVGDTRFGVLPNKTTADGIPHALELLHVQWWDGVGANRDVFPPNVVIHASWTDMALLADRARKQPGMTWSMGREPNGEAAALPEMQPARYAVLLHQVASAIHGADPTAVLVGPDVLNWTAPCEGCSGFVSGRDWTMAMRAAYVASFGEEPPFDVWTIHTYPLTWQHLPTVDYVSMQQHIIDYRHYLDGIPGLHGKPIWDSELGVHWGYEGRGMLQTAGNLQFVPLGRNRQYLVEAYLRQMLTWLTDVGPSYNVTRWFVWATFNPDDATDHAGGISLLDGPGPDAHLTSYGRIFADAALNAARRR